MASISEQRLREMEAEMNRFEQEIAPSPSEMQGGGGMIIGSSTFDQVQAQLRHLRQESSKAHAERGLAPPPPPPPPPSTSAEQNVPVSAAALAPPPPPPPEPSGEPPPLLPPPPPPPPLLNRPAFVPPQLRHRAPPPRPPMPPMGYRGPLMGHRPDQPYNQHMMGPGPMGPGGPMGPHGPMGPGPMGYDNPYHGYGGPGPMMGRQGPGYPGAGFAEAPGPAPSPAMIEAKPKVIYSAPPVRTVPKDGSKAKSDKEKSAETTAASANTTDTAPSSAAVATEIGVASDSAGIAEMEEDTTIADMELDMDVAAPTKKEKKEKKKKFIRTAANTVWEDPTLAEWDPDDFRMFCGDLGNEVTDEVLTRAFSRYPSFVKAKVVRDRRTNKTKGYGFASFKDPNDFTRAMREMNGKYVGNRPIKLRKSTWKDRSLEVVRKKEKEKKRLGLR